MSDLIRKLKLERKAVGHQDGGGHLHVDFEVIGWELELEEDDDVIWRLIASNPGPGDVRVVYCKPFTFGPWEIIERFVVPAGSSHLLVKQWRADNEDHFFFFEQKFSDADWRLYNGEGGNTVGALNQDKTAAEMRWYSPQDVHLDVRLRGA